MQGLTLASAHSPSLTRLFLYLKYSMETTYKDFIGYIEQSIKENWDLDALTDYQGSTLQYKDVARKIEKLHILFENAGVVPGD